MEITLGQARTVNNARWATHYHHQDELELFWTYLPILQWPHDNRDSRSQWLVIQGPWKTCEKRHSTLCSNETLPENVSPELTNSDTTFHEHSVIVGKYHFSQKELTASHSYAAGCYKPRFLWMSSRGLITESRAHVVFGSRLRWKWETTNWRLFTMADHTQSNKALVSHGPSNTSKRERNHISVSTNAYKCMDIKSSAQMP